MSRPIHFLIALVVAIFSVVFTFSHAAFAKTEPADTDEALDSSIEVIQQAATRKTVQEIKTSLASAWGPRLNAAIVLESMSSEALTALARTSFRRLSPSTVEIVYDGGKAQVEVLDAALGEYLINGRKLRVADFKNHAVLRQAIERIVQKTVSIANTRASRSRDWGLISAADAFVGTAVTDSILSSVIDLMVVGVGSSG